MTVLAPPAARPAHPVAARGTVLAVGFALATAGALALAVRAPLATTVLGLIGFGVLHNVLELRYVTGRFAGILRGRLLVSLGALITGIVLCRLAGARTPEILLGYAVLATGVLVGLRRWWLRAGGLAVLAVALGASLTWPAYHFVVLAHLHNVVPLLFLWEWSRTLPAGRALFRAAQVLWVGVVPALVLAGVFDPWLAGGASDVVGFAGPPASIAAPVTPPDVTIGLRFLVVFAYLQTMHYVVWVGFLPRCAPDAARAFDLRVPWLRGWRPWALGLGLAAAMSLVLVADYANGRLLYSSFASYHAYLEFPVLLALVFGVRARSVGAAGVRAASGATTGPTTGASAGAGAGG